MFWCEPDGLGGHDLVGRLLHHHPVLVDPRLVGKGIGADDRLVGLHDDAGDGGEQLAGGVDVLGVDLGWRKGMMSCRVRSAITTSSREQLPARSPMPLMVHSTCSAPAWTAARELATARPEVVVAVHGDDRLFDVRHIFLQVADDVEVLGRDGVADGVGDVDGGGAGVDDRLDHPGEKGEPGTGRVLGGELHVGGVPGGPFDRLDRRLHAPARRSS